MTLVIITIHCVLVLLSSARFLSSCFVVPSHFGATWHAYQLSLGCSESTGSGGRRLANSPGGSRALASADEKHLKANVGTKLSVGATHRTHQGSYGRLNCQEV